jgi:exoribonuclease-2
VRLGAIDEISLEVSGTVVERLDVPAADVSAEDDTGEDEEPVAGPIAIAVDVTEGGEPDNAADNPPS